ncbi:MAG TPA: polysaccharide biosynthesis protein [Verrucomicrobiae bacterium]
MGSIGTAIVAAPSGVTKAQPGRFGINLVSNVGQLGLSIVVGAWYVPFLVRKLGPAAYGLIPLASSITSYMALITLGLNSAVGRYLTIAFEQGDQERANRIFNTSFWGSIVLTGFLLVPATLGVAFVEHLIRVPEGFEIQARWLFAATTAAFLLNEIKTPFDVSSFCRNRFDLRNVVAVGEVLVRVGLVVALFYALSPSINFVGFGIFTGTVVSAAGAVWLWRVLTPSLRVNLRHFDWGILRELTGTGGWVVINHVGAILYLSIDLLVANRLFGAEQGGRYAAVLQLPLLIRTLGSTIGAVFSPTVLYYYARRDLDGLMTYLARTVKCLGLMLALPISLLCGFAEPVLRLWLGLGFSGLHPLLFLMAAHLCINVPILPLLGLQLATNRVKVPGLVTLVMGLANLGLALLLAGPMHWGLYGIAGAGAIMLTVKNVLFTPIYGAHVLGKTSGIFFRELALIVGVTAVTVVVCRGVLWAQPIAGWSQLVLASAAVSALYGMVVYRFILSVDERKMVRKMVPFLKG